MKNEQLKINNEIERKDFLRLLKDNGIVWYLIFISGIALILNFQHTEFITRTDYSQIKMLITKKRALSPLNLTFNIQNLTLLDHHHLFRL